MNETVAWALEERLWLEGLSVYDDLLDEACLMAFPCMGVMHTAEIRESLKNAPRWMSVEMTSRVLSRVSEGVVVLGYTAEARRDGAEPYWCYCTSTYYAESKRWRLVQHQQTIAG